MFTEFAGVGAKGSLAAGSGDVDTTAIQEAEEKRSDLLRKIYVEQGSKTLSSDEAKEYIIKMEQERLIKEAEREEYQQKIKVEQKQRGKPKMESSSFTH